MEKNYDYFRLRWLLNEVGNIKTELNIKIEDINPIYEEIKGFVNESRTKVYATVNTEMLNLHGILEG